MFILKTMKKQTTSKSKNVEESTIKNYYKTVPKGCVNRSNVCVVKELKPTGSKDVCVQALKDRLKSKSFSDNFTKHNLRKVPFRLS